MPNPNGGPKKFEKGRAYNPRGGAAHDPIKKMIKKLTTQELESVIDILLRRNREKMEFIVKDPQSSVLQIWICSIALHGIKRGDATALNALLDRCIGRVKDRVEVSGAPGGPQVVITLPANGYEAPPEDGKLSD